MSYKGFSYLLLFALICNSNVSAEHEIKITKFDEEKVKATANNIDNVRLSFIDLSKRKKIGIREINLNGETTNFIKIPSELLDHESKNYRWGAALQYNVDKAVYYLGLWQKGLYVISREGEILSRFETDNITHSVEVNADGNMLFPYSWSSIDEDQITEVTSKGEVVWQWKARDFIEKNEFSMSVSEREPENYVAITGAAFLDADTVVATLSQANVIAFINKKTGKVNKFIKDSRPHVPVVKDGKLIGYTIRRSNAIKLWENKCQCFKEISIIDEDAYSPKGNLGWSRSLSLQHLGKEQWFVSGIITIRQITSNGDEIWKASIEPKRQWKGFHKVVRYELK